jgi:hypothetical protein
MRACKETDLATDLATRPINLYDAHCAVRLLMATIRML